MADGTGKMMPLIPKIDTANMVKQLQGRKAYIGGKPSPQFGPDGKRKAATGLTGAPVPKSQPLPQPQSIPMPKGK